MENCSANYHDSVQCKIIGLEQRFSTHFSPRPVFSKSYNFIIFFFNPIEGRDPFKIFHDPLPGRDPAVEKPWLRAHIKYFCFTMKTETQNK
jgi:hypothetical protein